MLSFEHKKSVFKSFKELQEKQISNNRIDYVYPNSLQRGKIIATQLHPSGNGYVIGKYMDAETIRKKGYIVDDRGWVNIKEFTLEELNEIIITAMFSMSGKEIRFEPKIFNTKQDGGKTVVEQRNQEVISNLDLESLIRSCLYNWLGYGNINAPVWFLGIEEGGAEIWRNKTKTLEQSLELRSKFNIQMNFSYVWEELYNVSLESLSGSNVWRYMAAFLLEWEGKSSDPKDIQNYIFLTKKLGREDSNHFLGELMPLPKQSKESIIPYKSVWSSIQDYYEEVGGKRFSLITEAIVQHPNVRLVVSYDKILTTKFLNYFSVAVENTDNWQYEHEQYYLYKIFLTHERSIYLLSTPFFGNGRISYSGIRGSAKRVLSIVNDNDRGEIGISN